MPFTDDIKKIVDLKLERLESVPDAFSSRMIKIQRGKFNDIIALLDDLEFSKGSVVLNNANLLKIEQIVTGIEEVLTGSEFQDAVQGLLEEFDTQAAINYRYFENMEPKFAIPQITDAILLEQKRNAVKTLIASTDQYLTNPMREVLSNAVISGSSRANLLSTFRTLIQGDPDTVGRLERATRQIVSDSFALTDRAITNEVALQLDFQWFLYTGGLMDTTRPFCKSRNGKYFSKKEVQSWGNETWQGQMEGTNEKTIFVTAGGYNCQHSILPVSEAVVPNRFKNA